ncbi:hypothetical protein ONZ51_g9165 [Trametes cubensis]|uniref:Uncharacterized protein n=1 Tax=Trametes cubensis TaxID=1111947 RepID=A0AAD7TMA6_9APHY|nr:hypothetical protein ONZ51_g9165 [Trametes cubensis]
MVDDVGPPTALVPLSPHIGRCSASQWLAIQTQGSLSKVAYLIKSSWYTVVHPHTMSYTLTVPSSHAEGDFSNPALSPSVIHLKAKLAPELDNLQAHAAF